MKVKQDKFEQLVIEALSELPEELQQALKNIDVVVEDRPSRALLEEMGLKQPVLLLGVYQGVPLPKRSGYYGNVLPDKITIFQESIESICQTEAAMKEQVRKTVLHEVGHYFGFDESSLRQYERG